MVGLAEASAPHLHTGARERRPRRASRPTTRTFAPPCRTRSRPEQPDDVGRILGAIYPFLISHGHLAEVARVGRGGARRARPALRARAGRGARRRRRDRALRRRPRPRDRAEGAADVGAGRAPAAELAGGDARRSVRDRARPGRPRRRSRATPSAARRPAAAHAPTSASPSSRCATATSARRSRTGAPRSRASSEGAFNHACALELLGETARRAGDDDARAATASERRSRSFAALGDGGGVADALDGLARLAAAAGDAERAGRLRGAARAPARDAGPTADPRRPPVPGRPRRSPRRGTLR